MLIRITSTVFALLLAIASAGAQDQELQANLEEAHSQYEHAWTAGDADALAGLFTEDAVFWPADGGVFEGREQIREALQEGPNPTSAEIRARRIERIGDLVLDVGTFTIILPDTQGRMEGEYLALAEDTEEGIRILRLIGFPPRQRAPERQQ